MGVSENSGLISLCTSVFELVYRENTDLLSELFEEWFEVGLSLFECGTVQFTL